MDILCSDAVHVYVCSSYLWIEHSVDDVDSIFPSGKESTYILLLVGCMWLVLPIK